MCKSGLSRRELIHYGLATLATASLVKPARAAYASYGLEPKEIADGVYLLRGLDEHLTVENGGNIVNVVFMETGDGVVLFDTGPSRIYGEELRAVIERTTKEPLVRVIVSHAHPDHYLGNQVFEDLPIESLAEVQNVIADIGDLFTDNMYRLVDVWMRGTRTVAPTKMIQPGHIKMGKRDLEVIALGGHSQADLALYDHGENLLLAADLVFMDRAPTTPHAHLPTWQKALSDLADRPIKTLVPGHGPVTEGKVAIEQTQAYLAWIDEKLKNAAEQGLSEAEANILAIDPPFAEMAVVREEFERSVSHLYADYELQALERIN